MDYAIDLRQFRYFLALSDTLHFGRAALRLHISQPPLSRQIRQLEQQLGVALFIRRASGVSLTAAGAALVPEARKTLAQADRAIAAARAGGLADGARLVTGYSTVFDRGAMPDLTARLQERFPHTEFVVKGKHSVSLVRDIVNGRMDAAFIGLHTLAPGLQVETLREEALVVAMPARHRLARRRAIGFDDLTGEPMFWFERRANPGFYDYCARYFDSIGFTPNAVQEPPDHHILLGMIAAGTGVALIPASLRTVSYRGVVYRPLKKEQQGLSMGIAVAWLGSNQSPVLRAFLELARAQGDEASQSFLRPVPAAAR